MPAFTSLRAIQGAAGNAGVAEFYVGSLTAPTSTGTQAITGVGFQPTAVMLFCGENDLTGAGDDTWCIGFSVNDATNDRALGLNRDGTIVIGDAAFILNDQSVVSFEANMDSFDSDGFTLDWITVDGTAQPTVHYLAIGGVNAAVLPYQEPASTGDQALTGAGFAPTAAIGFFGGDPFGGDQALNTLDNENFTSLSFADGTNHLTRGWSRVTNDGSG